MLLLWSCDGGGELRVLGQLGPAQRDESIDGVQVGLRGGDNHVRVSRPNNVN